MIHQRPFHRFVALCAYPLFTLTLIQLIADIYNEHVFLRGALLTTVYLLGLGIMPICRRFGSIITIVAALSTTYLPFSTSQGLLTGVLLALAVIAYINRPQGVIAGTIIALSFLAEILYYDSTTMSVEIPTLLMRFAFVIAAFLSGAGLQWRQQEAEHQLALERQLRHITTQQAAIAEAQVELQQHQRESAIATHIHDQVSNQLTYLTAVLRHHIDERRTPSLDEIEQLQHIAQSCLAHTREAITLIDPALRGKRHLVPVNTVESSVVDPSNISTSANVNEDGDAPEPYDTRETMVTDIIGNHALNDRPAAQRDWIRDIVRLMRQYNDQLADLGYDGETIVPEETFGIIPSPEVINAIKTLLNECFANLMKYADTNGMYVIAVAMHPTYIMVSCTNSMPQAETTKNLNLDGTKQKNPQPYDPRDERHVKHKCVRISKQNQEAPQSGRGTGLGLIRCRTLIVALGGQFHAAAVDGLWKTEATIPLVKRTGDEDNKSHDSGLI